jgi:hypothetical protein
VLRLAARGEWGDHLPLMLNCIAPLTAITAVEQRFGSVFAPVAPDYRFAYRCLATFDTILYLDQACLIHYGMSRSAGISYMRGKPNEAAQRFERELSVERYGATPEPGFETNSNAIFQEYCSVRAEEGGQSLPPLDWPSYLDLNARSATIIEDPDWRARMEEVLSRHGWSRRRAARFELGRAAAICGYFARHPDAFARSLKRQLLERPPGTPLALLLARRRIDPRVRDELQFDSAAEAIAHAEAHPRARTSSAWHVHRLQRGGAIVRSYPPPD